MKKKLNKKLLVGLSSSIILSSIATIAAACKDTSKNGATEKQGIESKPGKEQTGASASSKTQQTSSPEALKNTFGANLYSNVGLKSLVDQLTINLEEFSPFFKDRKQVLPSKVEPSDVKLELSGLGHDIVNYDIIAKVQTLENGEDVSILQGKLSLSIVFRFKDQSKQTDKEGNEIAYIKVVTFDGFQSNRFNADHEGTIRTDILKDLKSPIEDYENKTQAERYQTDNEKYLNVLKQQAYRDITLEKRRPLLEQSLKNQSAIQKYNDIAKKIGQDSYESAALKGFTVPRFNADGKVDGLVINDGEGIPYGPSWVDALDRNPFRIDGLARYLPNEHYKRAANQTYAFSVNNPDPAKKDDLRTSIPSRGTFWLLDFAQPEQGKYPTKWYFGTNLHVADLIRGDSRSFNLTFLPNEIGTRTKLKTSGHDGRFKFATFLLNSTGKDDSRIGNSSELTAEQIKYGKKSPFVDVIYRGSNFLKSNPADYLVQEQKNKFQNLQEFADFAVVEIDFSQATKKDLDDNNVSSPEELAKFVTNGYALETNKDNWVKFKKHSYLKNYNEIDFPLTSKENQKKPLNKVDQLFALGYPLSVGDYFLENYIDEDQLSDPQWNVSLWVNSDSSFYNNLDKPENANENTKKEARINRGNFLSYQIGYRSFTNLPGVTDNFLASIKNGNTFYKTHDNKEYIAAGLNYLPRHYVPYGGASGTSIRNEKNELVAVFHSANSAARTGLAVAFRSEGYNYHGLYGAYNLPQYDLIYGKGKDQAEGKSFRESLLKKYGENLKTNLFQNTVKTIPDGYQFNNNDEIDVDPNAGMLPNKTSK
ncbi:Ig-specific serine endopeptidase MIP [Ureaplasma canigenitalium]|uniref:Ig-specific serine endopeptidase MIP n=1 Tax=Ureaplasma canigenitalium TaxID=42092 RepID=UPI000689AB66|nr:DUF31 family protein [Ureaplasma canigenitalium]